MKPLFLSLLLLLGLQLAAQEIQFKETAHDFGSIKEENGPVSYQFSFTNKGNKPLILQNVSASCGCTTPEWPRQPILPGKTGTIKAVFDPINREGRFDKNITIVSNATNGQQKLVITGTIEKKPPTLEDYYRQKVGSLNFKSTYAAFTSLKNTEEQSQDLEFVNLGDKPVRLEVVNFPDFARLAIAPQTVQPKQKGTVKIGVVGSKLNEYGYSMHNLPLKIDGVADPSYKLMLSVNLFEDFASLSPEQRKNAPVAAFANMQVQDLGQGNSRATVDYDFGAAKAGAKVEHVFELTNTGKSDLIIRQTKASCGCTAIAPSKTTIKPGEKAEIKAIFDTTGRTGPQSKSITVTLNDPQNPVVKLFLRGRIE